MSITFRYFQFLATHGDRKLFDTTAAGTEARQCQDLLAQAQYHVARARRVDEEEKVIRRKQEQEREAFRVRQLEEAQRAADSRRQQVEEMLLKRQEFKEKTKNALLFSDMPNEMKPKGKGRGRKDYISDSGMHSLKLFTPLHKSCVVSRIVSSTYFSYGSYELLKIRVAKRVALGMIRLASWVLCMA